MKPRPPDSPRTPRSPRSRHGRAASAVLVHSVPWRNPCPKPSAVQEALGDAGQKRVREIQLQEIRRRKDLDELREGSSPNEWDMISRDMIFQRTCPSLRREEIGETWQPILHLKQVSRLHYNDQLKREKSKAWTYADEWTRLKGIDCGPDTRVTSLRFRSTNSEKQTLSGYEPSPTWYKLSLTPRTTTWIEQKIVNEDKFGPQFMAEVADVERKKRIRDHIMLKMKARRRFNLEQERRFPTDYQRKVIRAMHTAAPDEDKRCASVFERLSSLTPRKDLPDLDVEDADSISKRSTNCTQTLEKLIDKVAPSVNLHILKMMDISPDIASMSRKQARESYILKQRDNRVRKKVQKFVSDELRKFEQRLSFLHELEIQKQELENNLKQGEVG